MKSDHDATGNSGPSQSGLLVDHFFRHQYGRLVAVLVRRFGATRLELIEDAIQVAMEHALGSWTRRGIPDAPEGWLHRVATNRLIDELRRNDRIVPIPEAEPAGGAVDQDKLFQGVTDEELRMLFACAHDAVPQRARLVLCLKLVCGFSTSEIAHRLFTSETNVQKILERGRATLAQVWHPDRRDLFFDLSSDDLGQRLASVQHVIHLLFNEGYSSERPDAPLRPDLCDDALRLGHLLITHQGLAQPSSFALLSVMHFHRARLESRVTELGELMLLSEQDRSRWDLEHLRQGAALLAQASQGSSDGFSRYHGEALILAEHCMAPSFDETRWSEIVELYELLERAYPNPLYTLNRAVALAEWKGPQAGLDVLERDKPPGWLAGHYLFQATIGELHRRLGNGALAVAHLEAALVATPTRAERTLFERRIARAQRGDKGR